MKTIIILTALLISCSSAAIINPSSECKLERESLLEKIKHHLKQENHMPCKTGHKGKGKGSNKKMPYKKK